MRRFEERILRVERPTTTRRRMDPFRARPTSCILPVVTGERDGIVEITPAGVVRSEDEAALLRLQARAGRYRVLAAPHDWVILRGDAQRACLLSAEIRCAGTLCDVLSFIGQTGWRGELLLEARGARSTSTRERWWPRDPSL